MSHESPQKPRVHPEREMAATCCMLARSRSPQLLYAGVILSSEDNLSNYISEKWYNASHTYFTFLLLQGLTVGCGIFITTLRISFLGLYFTFNEHFCNFTTVF